MSPHWPRAGIVVTNTPDVLTETTADFGFALMMATARRITEAERWLRDGHWQQLDVPDAARRATCTAARWASSAWAGSGRASPGAPPASTCACCTTTAAACRKRSSANAARSYVDFDTLLAQADHLVLVLPYSRASHHLVDAAALAKMKPTATLTNIARGGLVDEEALADALRTGRLAAAGLDVFEGEPAVDPRLLALRNVVLTPHIASGSLATRRAMVALAVDNLIAALGCGPRGRSSAERGNATNSSAEPLLLATP